MKPLFAALLLVVCKNTTGFHCIIHLHKLPPNTKVPFWNNAQIPLSKHSWELQIIAIWNTKDRACLNAHNKDWLKELAKEIPEAKWGI